MPIKYSQSLDMEILCGGHFYPSFSVLTLKKRGHIVYDEVTPELYAEEYLSPATQA